MLIAIFACVKLKKGVKYIKRITKGSEKYDERSSHNFNSSKLQVIGGIF